MPIFSLLFTTLIFSVILSSCGINSLKNKAENPTDAQITSLGEQMYRNGILPSGSALPAFIREDVEIDSKVFSCSSCHLRAGLGSYEGGIVTPPTTGNKLYKSYRRPNSPIDPRDQARRSFYAQTIEERPPYNRETLANAIRFGVDPAGHTFNDVMPRYPLDDSDMSILIPYLEQLSSAPSPGATPYSMKFATIITEDVSMEERTALLTPLKQFVNLKNQQMGMFNDFKKFGYSPTIEMTNAFRNASLDVWELKGSPETWRSQLSAYYSANNVFAVLSGISNKSWKPIHDFCEDEKLPCLFPITELPATDNTGWYSYYFNGGVAQEAEAVARYVNQQEDETKLKKALQIVQNNETGKAMAKAFEKEWEYLGKPIVTTVYLNTEELKDNSKIASIIKTYNPQTLLLWGDAAILPALHIAHNNLEPQASIFASSTLLGLNSLDIPDAIRNRVYLTYPHRLKPYTGSGDGYAAPVPILTNWLTLGEKRIGSKVSTALRQILLRTINQMNDNLHRDYLLDIIGMQMDITVRDYERISFGPGQRYLSKGCYIIQLGAGKNPSLIQKSEWVF